MIIRDVPILDLRGIPAERLAEIDEIANVRTILVTPENAETFMRIPRTEVRSHVIVKPDEIVAIGQLEFDDAYLHGLEDRTSLVVLGQALVDGFTPSLFFQKVQRLRMFGQVLYSDACSAGAILARAERLQGQLLPVSQDAVRWVGATNLDADRLRSVGGRPVVSIGPITIDPLLRVVDILNHLSSMTQIGEVKGTEELVCALLSRCRTRLGTYSVSVAQTAPLNPHALRIVPS